MPIAQVGPEYLAQQLRNGCWLTKPYGTSIVSDWYYWRLALRLDRVRRPRKDLPAGVYWHAAVGLLSTDRKQFILLDDMQEPNLSTGRYLCYVVIGPVGVGERVPVKGSKSFHLYRAVEVAA